MSASSGRRSTTRSGSRKASASTVARRAPRRSTRSHTREMQQTVLVVDDEPIVRNVVVRYLERDGYRTLEAGDGNEARRLLERDHPSLVVLDVMLPGVSGLELCRWIRSRSETPIVMLTALGEETDRI